MQTTKSTVLFVLLDVNLLLAGDDEGFVWLYDLSKVHSQLPDPEERERKGGIEIRHSKVTSKFMSSVSIRKLKQLKCYAGIILRYCKSHLRYNLRRTLEYV